MKGLVDRIQNIGNQLKAKCDTKGNRLQEIGVYAHFLGKSSARSRGYEWNGDRKYAENVEDEWAMQQANDTDTSLPQHEPVTTGATKFRRAAALISYVDLGPIRV